MKKIIKTSSPQTNSPKKSSNPSTKPAGKGGEFPPTNPNRKNERLERARVFAKQRKDNVAKRTSEAPRDRQEEIRPKRIVEKKEQPFAAFRKKASPTKKKYIREDRDERYEKKDGERRTFSSDHRKKRSSDDKKPIDKKRFHAKGDDSRTERKPFQSGKKSGGKSSGGFLKRPDAILPQKNMLSDKDGIRLNKYLANAGIAARRKCDELIADGNVQVNGKTILEMGFHVMPGDKVTFKNKPVKPVNYVYILLNKPKDYLTTVEDDRDRHTVMELIEDATNERVYPVGRLDRNTTGLLLLTNDGDLAQKLSHPSFGAPKIYEVELNKAVSPDDMMHISKGVELEDGIAKVDGIDYAHHSKKNIVGVSLHVGKNRIVRRIFESLGYSVERLDRTSYAGLTKRDLPRGRWRYLNEREVIKLKYLK